MDDSNKNYDSPDSYSIFSAETIPAKHAAATAKRFKTGDLIMNRYKVLSELGQGGMGVVYKCFDETAGIEIALKALPPELSHNTLEMEDIKDNFQIVHNLHHSRIAAYNNLERDPANGNYYLIMECCEGEDLRRWIKRKRREGALTINDVQPIVKQIADALDYAHEQKIIHRDIKPGNIMINATGKIKVLDFGLAAQIHTSMTRVSMVNYGTSGTGPYMAPEQWRGRKQGAATDQYSLAVMTYEMLSGDLPFESPDVTVLREAVLNDTPEELSDVPDHVNTAISRAMSKNPKERFNSCADFAAALAGENVAKTKTSAPAEKAFGKSGSVIKWIAAIIVVVLIAGGVGYLAREEAARKAREEAVEWNNTGDAAYNRKDYDEAVKWYRKAAEQENADGQNNLGVMYRNGYGVTKDYTEAVKWYRKAAEQGHADAQNNLGVMYRNGYGVTKDYSEAVKWYRKAAEQGHADAQSNLGGMYFMGDGVTKDYSEAVKWYRKAAEQGDAVAQNNLGWLYKNGDGVTKDYTEAVKWYRKAAEQGHAGGQNNLGVMYEYGDGVTKDYDEALKWYRKAAEQGDAVGQNNLGVMYQFGYGVKKDLEMAKYWYKKAADQGDETAKEHYNRLTGE